MFSDIMQYIKEECAGNERVEHGQKLLEEKTENYN